MKKQTLLSIAVASAMLFFQACKSNESQESTESAATESAAPGAGQSGVQDDVSQPNVVKVAVGSKDHTTLVAAVKAAGLVDALSNNGPFTVFAPTNAAFDALPKGTLDELLKPEKKGDLENILYDHVIVGVMKPESFTDGQTLTMFGGAKATVAVKDGKVTINGANIIASVPASNGIVHVVDQVLLPKK